MGKNARKRATRQAIACWSNTARQLRESAVNRLRRWVERLPSHEEWHQREQCSLVREGSAKPNIWGSVVYDKESGRKFRRKIPIKGALVNLAIVDTPSGRFLVIRGVGLEMGNYWGFGGCGLLWKPPRTIPTSDDATATRGGWYGKVGEYCLSPLKRFSELNEVFYECYDD